MSIEVAVRPQEPKSSPPAFVQGKLFFTARSDEKPYAYTYKPPEGVAGTNIRVEPHEVRIDNMRVAAPDADLDVEGFHLVRHESVVADFWDEAQTMALGHPETAELVKAVTGAQRVVVFDHTLRRRIDGAADRTPGVARQPAARIHVDQTVFSGPQRVRQVMGGQAEQLLKRRAAIINVWRSIAHIARDWPLAFADARTIAPGDLIAQDLIFPHRKGEIYGVGYNPGQRWLYAPDLAPGEAVLIKCWDSDEDAARFTPHSAFDDPTTPEGTPPRESIEFRTIAFF